MQTGKFTAQYVKGSSVRLKPFSDVHMGDPLCDIKAFREYIEDRDDQTYFMGIGDYADLIIPGDPRYTKVIDDYQGEDVVDEQISQFVEMLQPIAREGKLIGLGMGNHERKVLKHYGTNPVQRMCRRLECRNLGYSGLLNLTLTRRGKNSRSVIIRYHHGFGGASRLAGGDLTKFMRETANWDADLFLYGHVHKLQTDQTPRMGLAGSTLVAKPQHVLICGTFKKTFSKGAVPTWSEEMGFPPRNVGAGEIELTPKKIGTDIKIHL